MVHNEYDNAVVNEPRRWGWITLLYFLKDVFANLSFSTLPKQRNNKYNIKWGSQWEISWLKNKITFLWTSTRRKHEQAADSRAENSDEMGNGTRLTVWVQSWQVMPLLLGDCLQHFSNLSVHQNHQEDLLKQIAELQPHRVWLSRSGGRDLYF